MTSTYTKAESRRLQALEAKQRFGQLSREELDELNRLEFREEAEWLLEGICGGMACGLNVERALEGVHAGLRIAINADDAAKRVRGLKIGLEGALDAPDALLAAIRIVLRKLEK